MLTCDAQNPEYVCFWDQRWQTSPSGCGKAFEQARCCRLHGCGAPDRGKGLCRGSLRTAGSSCQCFLGRFHCFECIESAEKAVPATAAEQPGPLPAAGEPAPGTVSSMGLVTHVAFSTFDLIRQLICSQNHNWVSAWAAVCIYKLLTKRAGRAGLGRPSCSSGYARQLLCHNCWEKPGSFAGDALWYSAGGCFGSYMLPKGEIFERWLF